MKAIKPLDQDNKTVSDQNEVFGGKALELKINPEYYELVPRPSEQEYQSLRESIQERGQDLPIIINPEYEILDGHTRYKICKELGTLPECKTREFENKLLEKQFVIEVNLKRRHLNTFQRGELVLPLAEIESELARQRQISGTLASNESKGKASVKVGKQHGIGANTLDRIKFIKKSADNELISKLRLGKTTINQAYKTLRRKEKKKNQQPLPDGKFSIIMADCPWQYDHNQQATPENHYDTMSVEAICALDIPSKCADDSVLFHWAPAPKLKEALRVMEAWGFRYVTQMVMIKKRQVIGDYLQVRHEILLIGKKGNLPIPEPEDRPSSVFDSSETIHSKKPDVIYDIIEKMYPNQKYLELFARIPEQQHFSATAQQRRNWTYWGNEVDVTYSISNIENFGGSK